MKQLSPTLLTLPATTTPLWRRRVATVDVVRVLTVVIVAALVLYPLFWMVLGSLQLNPMRGGFTLRAYERVFSSPYLPAVLWNTVLMAVGTTVAAVAVGVPMAWVIARTDVPFKRLFNLVALVPFITPPMVGAIAWSYLGGPNSGFLNTAWMALTGSTTPLVNIFTLHGMVLVMALNLTPYVFLLVSVSLQNMDPSLENAAAVTGAGPLRILFTVTLPLALPAIASSALLVLIQALEIFAIPATIGSPGGQYVFVTQIYRLLGGVPPRFNEAAALSMPLLLVCAAALWLQQRALGRDKSYTTVSGKAFRAQLVRLGRWRLPVLMLPALYLLLAAVLPYLVFLYGSVIRSSGLPVTSANLTTEWITRFFTGQASPMLWRAIGNSLMLSVGGATAGVLLATLCAYFTTRERWRGRCFLEFLALAPIAIPGAVIAVGLLWAYIRPPFQLYGTFTILFLAYITRYLPFGIKSVASVMLQVSPDLEKASVICGASWMWTFFRILVPVVIPGVLAGWMLMFVSMMRELSASVMLYTSNHETVAVALYLLWDEASFQYVSLLSLVLVAVSLASLALIKLLARFANPTGAIP
ncbi:ABC transporter permease [Roseomonas elaeocarpi]|uniref:ABC transporter permease n=1 Tax=Roseomonas elaeocarpi TaxID=907779 RepID=A0ABV6JMZ3_9PROT